MRIEAADRFTPAMRQKIDLAKLYDRARRLLPDVIDDTPPLVVPEACPVTLDELLARETD